MNSLMSRISLGYATHISQSVNAKTALCGLPWLATCLLQLQLRAVPTTITVWLELYSFGVCRSLNVIMSKTRNKPSCGKHGLSHIRIVMILYHHHSFLRCCSR